MLIDIITYYGTIISLYNQPPFQEVAETLTVLLGFTIGIKLIRDLSKV